MISYDFPINRITPAYAGKSPSGRIHIPRQGDHPRIRGEKVRESAAGTALLGSPPHTRGKDLFYELFAVSGGITPAYAGKSCYVSFAQNRLWDHPRIRGEKLPSRRVQIRVWGSPPHTRGKVFCFGRFSISFRITPAYAGKRKQDIDQNRRIEDHPRIRGEKPRKPYRVTNYKGSPPHTRGKVLFFRNFRLSERITPAYAGKSLSVSSLCSVLWDHPRIRGEKFFRVQNRL